MNKKEIQKCVNSLKKQAVDKILKDRDFLEKWFISEDDKLCTEFIADSLSDYGLKHYTNYCNRDGKSIVKNVKRRGFPNWEEVFESIAEQLQLTKEEVQGAFSDCEIDEYFWNEVQMQCDNLQSEFTDFVVVGRMGGYWGLKYDKDYISIDSEKLRKCLYEIKDGFIEFLQGESVQVDVISFSELICYFEEYWENEGCDFGFDYCILSEKFVEVIKSLDETIEYTIKDFESTEYWVENLSSLIQKRLCIREISETIDKFYKG